MSSSFLLRPFADRGLVEANVNDQLKLVLQVARTIPVESLPRLLGDLEEVKAVAFSRLTASALAPAAPEEWLTAAEASARLHCSRVYLYKNSHTLPFARHLGKKLLFSARGIEEYLEQKS